MLRVSKVQASCGRLGARSMGNQATKMATSSTWRPRSSTYPRARRCAQRMKAHTMMCAFICIHMFAARHAAQRHETQRPTQRHLREKYSAGDFQGCDTLLNACNRVWMTFEKLDRMHLGCHCTRSGLRSRRASTAACRPSRPKSLQMSCSCCHCGNNLLRLNPINEGPQLRIR
jgi:hypothetical protein